MVISIASKARIDQNTKLLAEMVSVYSRELSREKQTFSESILTSLLLNYQVMMINILDIFDAAYIDDEDDDKDDNFLPDGVKV